MRSDRVTAISVGILYITGTVAGVGSVIFTGSLLEGPQTLGQIAAQPYALILGALCVLLMGFALAMIPALLYRVLSPQHPGLAMGYIVFRGALEPVCSILIALSWLLLITLSRDFVSVGMPAESHFQTLGAALIGASDWISRVLALVFSTGALMLYAMLYQTRLVPRWLSVWGLAAILMHLADGLLGLFGLVGSFSTFEMLLNMPIFIQEMVMAVWLIAVGFRPAALTEASTPRLSVDVVA